MNIRWFLQSGFSKNYLQQNSRPIICFKIHGPSFEALRKTKAQLSVLKTRPRVCVITRPMLYQSVTVV